MNIFEPIKENYSYSLLHAINYHYNRTRTYALDSKKIAVFITTKMNTLTLHTKALFVNFCNNLSQQGLSHC